MSVERHGYDPIAGHFHLIFENWEASMARQAAALGPILERECGPAESVRLLDCACGIGTQALGLARAGFQVAGCDLSEAAVQRARTEAAARGLSIEFTAANMMTLDDVSGSPFDGVICMDNALPHLDGTEQLTRAAASIRSKLRPGGLFLASIRDYDRVIAERPQVQGPAFFSDEGRRRIVFQVWDWKDERRYVFHLYITREAADGWETHHMAAGYRAILREELTGILSETGFEKIEWMFPAKSGFYQPLVLARKPGVRGSSRI